MGNHHAAIAVTLAVAGIVVLFVSSAEWAAPLFSFALIEAGVAVFARRSRRGEAPKL
jgi:hypothetical protein